MQYALASQDYQRFIIDARDSLNLATTHQAFTVVQSVLWVFRRRLQAEQAIRFAQFLPPVLAAMFLQDWDPRQAAGPFLSREEHDREVRSVRPDHNFSSANAVETIAAVLRRHVRAAELDRLLTTFSTEALQFWRSAE
ncbi:MAG: DUF2267 domain-containing protein [Hyphomicrobiaceae bacterium]|nr:MAG: DUF2267 domain-containing protein [Hyphomicrobiaceae bacterium]